MEVILKEDYLSLGYVGDKVRVKGGFARNFLLPRGIAVEASTRNARLLNHQLSAILAKRLRRKAEAEEFGKTLQHVIVEFTLKFGSQGKSFGSVTARDVEVKLQELGYKVDRRQIRIVEVIKAVGTHRIEVKLHSDVIVPLQVKVYSEKAAEEVAPSREAKKGKKGAGRKSKAEAGEDEEILEASDSAEESTEEA